MCLGCQQNLAGLMTPCRLPCLLKLNDWFLLLLEYFWLFQCTYWKTKWDRHGYKTEDLPLSRYLGDYHCYFPVGMHYNQLPIVLLNKRIAPCSFHCSQMI